MIALRYAYVLALVVWLGGAIAIGMLAAPSAFAVLEANDPAAGRSQAGSVVGETLRRFRYVEWVAGATLLVTLVVMKLVGPRPLGFGARLAIVSVMLGCSLAAGLWIDPEAGRLRAAMGSPIDQLPASDERRQQFGRLHGASTALMGLTILGGLALCFWETRE